LPFDSVEAGWTSSVDGFVLDPATSAESAEPIGVEAEARGEGSDSSSVFLGDESSLDLGIECGMAIRSEFTC